MESVPRRGRVGWPASGSDSALPSSLPPLTRRWRVGAAVNYLLISTPFRYLSAHTSLPLWAVSACSVGVGTTFFFLWNYFVNFRTNVRKRDALPRYLGAVLCMAFLSSCLLTALKHFNFKMALQLGRFPLDLDIVATQFFLSGLKFFLYHVWVFPLPKSDVASAAPAAVEAPVSPR